MILGETAEHVKSYYDSDGVIQASDGMFKPIYWLSLASDGTLPDFAVGVMEHPIASSDIVTARDRQIAHLTEIVNARDHQIANLNNEIRNIYQSHSWRLTQPIRYLKRLLTGRQ